MVDALNRATSVGGTALSYDSRGNLTNDGSGQTYGYDADNRLVSGSGGLSFQYDALGRLYETAKSGSETSRLLYDGADLIAEYDDADNLQRRYVHGPGADEPLVWYEGTGTSDRRFLVADERGSVVAVTNASGAAIAINKYDPYGRPDAGNLGRFQYTGQQWIGDAGLYYYKARFYHAGLGRFMQTDPIGYEDGMNLYAYVGGDPINVIDPAGTQSVSVCGFLSACFYGRLYMGEFIGGQYAGQSVKGDVGGHNSSSTNVCANGACSPESGVLLGSSSAEDLGDKIVVKATRTIRYEYWPATGVLNASFIGGGAAAASRDCCIGYRVRVQAQGGRGPEHAEESASYISGSPIPASTGLELLDELWAKLTWRQQSVREEAFGQARRFILSCAAGGGCAPIKRSFYGHTYAQANRAYGIRVDVEIQKGINFGPG